MKFLNLIALTTFVFSSVLSSVSFSKGVTPLMLSYQFTESKYDEGKLQSNYMTDELEVYEDGSGSYITKLIDTKTGKVTNKVVMDIEKYVDLNNFEEIKECAAELAVNKSKVLSVLKKDSKQCDDSDEEQIYSYSKLFSYANCGIKHTIDSVCADEIRDFIGNLTFKLDWDQPDLRELINKK